VFQEILDRHLIPAVRSIRVASLASRHEQITVHAAFFLCGQRQTFHRQCVKSRND
jgi:hypothetical protein